MAHPCTNGLSISQASRLAGQDLCLAPPRDEQHSRKSSLLARQATKSSDPSLITNGTSTTPLAKKPPPIQPDLIRERWLSEQWARMALREL